MEIRDEKIVEARNAFFEMVKTGDPDKISTEEAYFLVCCLKKTGAAYLDDAGYDTEAIEALADKWLDAPLGTSIESCKQLTD